MHQQRKTDGAIRGGMFALPFGIAAWVVIITVIVVVAGLIFGA